MLTLWCLLCGVKFFVFNLWCPYFLVFYFAAFCLCCLVCHHHLVIFFWSLVCIVQLVLVILRPLPCGFTLRCCVPSIVLMVLILWRSFLVFILWYTAAGESHKMHTKTNPHKKQRKVNVPVICCVCLCAPYTRDNNQQPDNIFNTNDLTTDNIHPADNSHTTDNTQQITHNR